MNGLPNETMDMMAYYIHQFDPVAFKVFSFGLRWYSLAYFLGFLLAYQLLKKFARQERLSLKPEKVGDFVFGDIFLGVILGGRLGYYLFYYLPEWGWNVFASDPLFVFKIWQGGMSSHGGILGVLFASLWYAKRNSINWLQLGDALVVVAPIGIFLGRIANFINGELFGRVTQVTWGFKFPTALLQLPEHQKNWPIIIEQGEKFAPEVMHQPNQWKQIEYLITQSQSNNALAAFLGDWVLPRHPSQLYEAFLEGGVLFAILFGIYQSKFFRSYGWIAGLFFILYALFRVVVEQFREPDSALVSWLTKGQFYSLFMILIALSLFYLAKNQAKLD